MSVRRLLDTDTACLSIETIFYFEVSDVAERGWGTWAAMRSFSTVTQTDGSVVFGVGDVTMSALGRPN